MLHPFLQMSVRNVAIDAVTTMGTLPLLETLMYERILVPLDGGTTSECGLREAIALATLTRGQLHLLHVVDAYPIIVEIAAIKSAAEYRLSLIQAGETMLQKAFDAARQAGVDADMVVRDVVHQPVAEAIIEEATKSGCGLIVMGSHGRRGLTRWTLGSDAERVVRASPVPVLVVRAPAHEKV